MNPSLRIGLFAMCWTCIPGAMSAGDGLQARLRTLALDELSSWVSDPELIAEIREKNAEHAGLSQNDIDQLDRQWLEEVHASEQPLISELMGRHWSIMLRQLQDLTDGLVVETLIMDNRGLTIAQSGITTDYWQGDEPKFTESYGQGADAIHIAEKRYDASMGMELIQVSLSITDPTTGEVIGAATFGLDLNQLP